MESQSPLAPGQGQIPQQQQMYYPQPQGFPQQGYPQQGFPQQGPPQQGFPQYYQPPMLVGGGTMPTLYTQQQQIQMINQAGPMMLPLAGPKKSGFQMLSEYEGLFIKQHLDILEVITGCDRENVYYVYPLGSEGTGQRLFKCQEKSSWCARNCMPASCKPFKMTISACRQGTGDVFEPFLELERPCKCTCLCFARPEMMVTLVEDRKNEHLGRIVEPFTMCNLKTDVYDKEGTKTHIIEASCCQLGLIIKAPCDSCQKIDFVVKSPGGEVVSTLVKTSQGCVEASVSTADNFSLSFPRDATVHQKALLLSSVLLIDFMNFEEKPNQNRNQQNNNYRL